MSPMSPSGGRRRAESSPSRPPLLPLTSHFFGVVVLGVAWLLLVRVAIGFGADVRGGSEGAWWRLAATSLAAVACLLGALLLLRRMAVVAGIISAYQPKRARRHP
jgi:hypothetical protein